MNCFFCTNSEDVHLSSGNDKLAYILVLGLFCNNNANSVYLSYAGSLLFFFGTLLN